MTQRILTSTTTEQEKPSREHFCSKLKPWFPGSDRGSGLERAEFAPAGFRHFYLQILDSEGEAVELMQSNRGETPQQYNALLYDGSGPYKLQTAISTGMNGSRNELPQPAEMIVKIANQAVVRDMYYVFEEGDDLDEGRHQLVSQVTFTVSADADAIVAIENIQPTNTLVHSVGSAEEQREFEQNIRTGVGGLAKLFAKLRRETQGELMQYWHLHLKRS